jgi:hypothetical protein
VTFFIYDHFAKDFPAAASAISTAPTTFAALTMIGGLAGYLQTSGFTYHAGRFKSNGTDRCAYWVGLYGNLLRLACG